MTWDEFVTSLKEWQTLLAGVIALGAAFWTIRTMQKQMADADRRHREQHERRKFSMHAQMPDALSAICAYAAQVGKYVVG